MRRNKQSTAGSMSFDEVESRARRREVKRESEMNRGTSTRGETDGGSKGGGGGDDEWRRSREDLQEDTRWVCLRHVAFLTILSRVGPTIRPTAVFPGRNGESEDDIIWVCDESDHGDL